MTTVVCSFDRLSDADLILEIKKLARCEREATATLIASLMELDARRLYLAEGCSSLFTYCTEVLHLSEHAAFGRIRTARAARAFPVIFDLLVDGSIHLTTVTLLAPHLTQENHIAVLAEARHKSKRQIEELAARLAPRPDIAATIRKLPGKKTSAGLSCASDTAPVVTAPEVPLPVALGTPPVVQPASQPAAQLNPQPAPRPGSGQAEVTPLAPERYKVQFTVSKETHDKLRRVQDLLRHSLPNGDPAVIFDKALTLLLAAAERAKTAATAKPRTPRPATSTGSRHIPADVRRTVWKRDGGRCAFVGTNGRCTETGCVEFHHVVPFADGGATSSENLELRCKAHNQFEAEKWFGARQPRLAREPRIEFG